MYSKMIKMNRSRTQVKVSNKSVSQKEIANKTSIPITSEEHAKVLARNKAVVRENACLKEQLRHLKNEILALRANENDHRLDDTRHVLEAFISNFCHLYNECNNLNSSLLNIFEGLETMKPIFDDCFSIIRNNYPDYAGLLSGVTNDGESEREWETEASNENSDANNELLNNSRFSMSSQEREKLSTIVELSMEMRSSSGHMKRDSLHRVSASRKSFARKSSLKFPSVTVEPISEAVSEAENNEENSGQQNATNMQMNTNAKLAEIEKVLECTENAKLNTSCDPQNRPSRQLSMKSQICRLDSGKRSIASTLSSRCSDVSSLALPQHSSSPYDNCQIDSLPKTANDHSIDITFNDMTARLSTATILAEETRLNCANSFSKTSVSQNLTEISETPQTSMRGNNRPSLIPRLESNCDQNSKVKESAKEVIIESAKEVVKDSAKEVVKEVSISKNGKLREKKSQKSALNDLSNTKKLRPLTRSISRRLSNSNSDNNQENKSENESKSHEIGNKENKRNRKKKKKDCF